MLSIRPLLYHLANAMLTGNLVGQERLELSRYFIRAGT